MSLLGELPPGQLVGRNCPGGNCLSGNDREWELPGCNLLEVGIFRRELSVVGVVRGGSFLFTTNFIW